MAARPGHTAHFFSFSLFMQIVLSGDNPAETELYSGWFKVEHSTAGSPTQAVHAPLFVGERHSPGERPRIPKWYQSNRLDFVYNRPCFYVILKGLGPLNGLEMKTCVAHLSRGTKYQKISVTSGPIM